MEDKKAQYPSKISYLCQLPHNANLPNDADLPDGASSLTIPSDQRQPQIQYFTYLRFGQAKDA
jgi:hypothetical protein